MNLKIHIPNPREFFTRLLVGVLLSILSAFLLAYSLAGYNAPLLAWIGTVNYYLTYIRGFVPSIVAQYHFFPAGVISALAPAITFGGFYLAYLVPVFWPERETETPPSIGLLPLYIFVLLFFAMLFDRKNQESTGFHLFPVKVAVAFSAIETIRLWIPIAASWGWIGYSQVRVPWLIQPISVFGTISLNFLIFFVNWTLGFAAIYLCRKYIPIDSEEVSKEMDLPEISEKETPKEETKTPKSKPHLRITPIRVRRWLISCAIILGFWTILSLILLGATKEDSTTMRVATISGVPRIQVNESTCGFSECGNTWANIPQDNRENLEWLRQRTLRAAHLGANLVVWPEKQFLFDPLGDYGNFYNSSWLSNLAIEANAYISFAYGYKSPSGMVIGAGLVDPLGQLLGTYGKDHPVTFQGESSVTSGTYPSYETPYGRIGQIICYDLDFTDTVRKMVKGGAQIILIPSGDWPGISDKHYIHVVFRAIENRVTLIKVDKGYDSAIINSKGHIIASCINSQWNECTMYADVHPGHSNSAYSKGGEWFGYLMIAIWSQILFLDTVISRIKPLRESELFLYYFEPWK